MGSEIEIRLKGVAELAKHLEDLTEEAERELEQAMAEIAAAWAAEAEDRAPVETGNLEGTILHDSGKTAEGYFAAVGSNESYAAFIEFGTRWIAGGAVKALGLNPNITDASAVTSWPAKEAGGAKSGEQMPFLRPAFMALEPWILKRLKQVFDKK